LILPKIIEIIDKNLMKDIKEIIENSKEKIKMNENEIDFDSILTSNIDDNFLSQGNSKLKSIIYSFVKINGQHV
jgi:hypothetical protein